jgi:hypothetical protein
LRGGLDSYRQKHKLNIYDYIPLTFIVDFDDPDCEKKITLFSRMHRSIEMFNEQRSKGAIQYSKGAHYMAKDDYQKLVGVAVIK